MRFLKSIFDFYINSSIHVALAVFSLTWITIIQFHIEFDVVILFFIFFATITGYNFIKYFGLAKFHHRRLANWLKIIQLFSLLCFILLCYLTFQLQFRTLLYIIGFGVVTFLYAIPFLPKRLFLDSQQNLRAVSGLKIYVIALVWSGVTVFLPLINADFDINTDVVLTAIQRFLLVIALMLPFEIRDLKYDSLKLSTIPQKIGVTGTKISGIILLLFFFLIEFFKDEITQKNIIIILIVTIITQLAILFAKKYQSKYYSGFWVESIPVFWLLLILVF